MQPHIRTRRDSARPGVTRMVMCVQPS